MSLLLRLRAMAQWKAGIPVAAVVCDEKGVAVACRGDIDGRVFPRSLFMDKALTLRGCIRARGGIIARWGCSALIAAGLDIVSISRGPGHESPALTLSVYPHLFNNDDSKAAAVIDATLRK